MMVADISEAVRSNRPEHRRTGQEIARTIMRLFEIRSRLDRTMWNLSASAGEPPKPMPWIRDWQSRYFLLVSVGVAFEDISEVLAHALRDPEGTSTDDGFIHRCAEAYCHLAMSPVPWEWMPNTPDRRRRKDADDHAKRAWKAICDAFADILNIEPRYGVEVPPPKEMLYKETLPCEPHSSPASSPSWLHRLLPSRR
jgi:hypothetical protein